MSELKETPTPVDEKKTGEEPEVKTEENSVENPEEKSVEKPEEKPKDNSKELAEENKEEVVDEVTKTRKPPGKSQKKRRKVLKISLIVFGILVHDVKDPFGTGHGADDRSHLLGDLGHRP